MRALPQPAAQRPARGNRRRRETPADVERTDPHRPRRALAGGRIRREGGVEHGEPEAAPAHAGRGTATVAVGAHRAARPVRRPAQLSRTRVGAWPARPRRLDVEPRHVARPGGRPRDPRVLRRRAGAQMPSHGVPGSSSKAREARWRGRSWKRPDESKRSGRPPAGEPVERRVRGVDRRVDPGAHVVGARRRARTPRGRSGPRRRCGSWRARAAGCRSACRAGTDRRRWSARTDRSGRRGSGRAPRAPARSAPAGAATGARARRAMRTSRRPPLPRRSVSCGCLTPTSVIRSLRDVLEVDRDASSSPGALLARTPLMSTSVTCPRRVAQRQQLDVRDVARAGRSRSRSSGCAGGSSGRRPRRSRGRRRRP